MKHLLLPLLLYSFLLGKCYGVGDPGFWLLLFTNDSETEVACLVATDDIGFSYPDTLLPKKLKTADYAPQLCINYIAPLDTEAIFFDSAYSWYQVFDLNTQVGVMSVYVFSADSLRNINWERIRNNNIYITRYDLTAKDLNNIGRDEKGMLVIHYPPSDNMKEVHVFTNNQYE